MTGFIFKDVKELGCVGCGCEITLDQYRRKIARCNQCEADAIIAQQGDWQTFPESWTP